MFTSPSSSNTRANPPHYPGIDEPFPAHPFAEKFPLLSDKKLQALADNIEAIGQLVPITLYAGRILDGRNRYSALALVNQRRQQNKEKPIALKYGHLFEEETPQNNQLAWLFVKAHNCHRRPSTQTIKS
ncbi:hypothetical protein H6G45_06440 [Synechocystis sp. FACHB-383]|uniref:hypothetical protein n=1 Tax=Synechocystis sp. FACHB-383 TaxID=2692864 RepID=UPI0016898ACC|nr:hypothetical protein [Synechocystis sp. FACHB-383]MBD2653131.1 hypothetical protein [Synechocystis sp. FACHB-383]